MKTKKKSSWFVSIPLILIAAGYLYFVFLPLHKKSKDLEVDLRSKKSFINRSINLDARISTTDDQIAEIRQYIDAQRGRLANDSNRAAVFGELSRLTSETGNKPTHFEPLPAEAKQTYQRLPVRIGATGSFASAAAMLASLDQFPTTAWIESFRLQRASNSEKLASEVNLAIFSESPDKSD